MVIGTYVLTIGSLLSFDACWKRTYVVPLGVKYVGIQSRAILDGNKLELAL